MNILLNGENTQIDEGLTAARLVDQLGLAGKRLAMEVNLEILPRSEFDAYCFSAGDKVEIVHAIGGG